MNLYLERAQRAIDQAVTGMTPEQFTAHPQGKWSVAEILEHLAITYTSTVKLLNRCLKHAEPIASSPTLYQRAATALVVGLGYMPTGRQAPSFARPTGISAQSALQSIRQSLPAMDEVITACEQRFGPHIKIADHVVLGPLSVPQWRKFHWVHTRHHMKQIAQRRARTGSASK